MMPPYCDECQAETQTEVVAVNKSYTVRGKTFEIKHQVRRCKACGNDVFDEKIDNETLLAIRDKRHELDVGDTDGDFHDIRQEAWNLAASKAAELEDKEIDNYLKQNNQN